MKNESLGDITLSDVKDAAAINFKLIEALFTEVVWLWIVQDNNRQA